MSDKGLNIGVLQTTEGDLDCVAGAVAEYFEVSLGYVLSMVRGHIPESVLPSSGEWKAESAPLPGAVHVGPKDMFCSHSPTVFIKPSDDIMADVCKRFGVPAKWFLTSGCADYIARGEPSVDVFDAVPAPSVLGDNDE
ncbi:MAG: hypothetical protein UT33_C0011G0128 [Candidatus Peregrinibacteria bacterium GW2011_GWC2_39_14]|nr:MAG: hypothetical protein UT33_C0011G0128 [Candidatus Peregrinibacteria bacterium GW2011_GWC2_39_14]